MALAKEVMQGSVIDYPSGQPTETLRGEQNSFLRFINENKDIFDRHSSLTYELRDEEQGWRNSPTIDFIVEKSVELAVTMSLSPNLGNLSGKAVNKVVRRATEKIRTAAIDVIFGNFDEKDKLVDKMFPFAHSSKFRFTPQQEAPVNMLEESMNDYRASFREAISPLANGVRESRTELIKKFEDFLLSEPSNLFAFQDFLSDKKNYGSDREVIRPFLASLVQTERTSAKEKKEGILHRSVAKWVNDLTENPRPAIIDEFIASVKSPAILEWLEFAAQGQNIADFLKSRPDVFIWPSELKNALFSFISSRYYDALSSTGRDLEQFGRPLSAKSILPRIDLDLEEEKVVSRAAIKKKPGNKTVALEKAKKETYQIGVLTRAVGSPFEVSVLTEEELTGRLQKEADSLAPSDSKMMQDLKNICANLQKDPYGLSTKKLTDKFVVVGHRSFPLRSINPGKRIGLFLDHPESTRVRIVYIIYRDEKGPVIGIEGIYKHEEYDKKFA